MVHYLPVMIIGGIIGAKAVFPMAAFLSAMATDGGSIIKPICGFILIELAGIGFGAAAFALGASGISWILS